MALTGVFPKKADEEVPRTPLALVKCGGCGLVQLRESCPPHLLYGDHYGYRSGLNASMVRHLEEKVQTLQGIRPLTESDIVLDIGSNDGTLLNSYPDTVTRLGFDPSVAKFSKYYKQGVFRSEKFFSADVFRHIFHGRKAAIITSIAMFYDLEAPLEFMREVKSILAPDGIWHLEQSYLRSMLRQTAYDTICQEHLEYYGLSQIQWMAEKAGLKIVEASLNDINGGSVAVTLAHAENGGANTWVNAAKLKWILLMENAGASDKAFAEFVNRIEASRCGLLNLLNGLKVNGQKVLGYGASTKGNVILQYCGITPELIPAIMEVNESKFGCFTPGTKIPIISETEGHAMNPDYLLVLPWHFAANIMERESGFRARGGKLIFPLPGLVVV
jgi:SAM-dependent methyltransferase